MVVNTAKSADEIRKQTRIKASLYDLQEKPYVWNFIAGLAGRDITVENFTEMADGVEAAAADKLPQGATWSNVRE